MIVMDALPIALLGALLGLDAVTFPQAMISRPIVAATAAGAFIGHPLAGLTLGAVLELIALGMLPFGASKYPEWGSASVVGGALYASQAADSAGALPASLLAALVTALVGGWSMIRLRRINASRAAHDRADLDAGSASAVVGLQLFGLTADFIRGGLVTMIAMLALSPVVKVIAANWHTNDLYSRAFVVTVASAVAVGSVWKIFHSVPWSRVLFFAGFAGGLSLLLTR
jgi:mannose/fructose/N-acetylgalactosamine-specific phosphotransferase system component IIC